MKPQDNDHENNQMTALENMNNQQISQPLKQTTRSKSLLIDDFALAGNQDNQMILDTNEEHKTESMM